MYDNIKKYELPLSDLLGIFNDEFIQKYASLRALFTCILIEINTKKQLYVYSSAGHPSALILRGKNRILLSRTGTLIGGFDKAKYRIMEGHLEKGDKLFLFTDGIYEEFKNGAEFGEERLHGILAGNPGLSLDDTIQDALIALDDFLDGEEKQDDITILGIRIKNFI
ncbi:MAG: serine/threonine-protein phosphatase [Leptospira sp.]|nr:serine/threonine-protein phosphatase [Leptospira sp.]